MYSSCHCQPILFGLGESVDKKNVVYCNTRDVTSYFFSPEGKEFHQDGVTITHAEEHCISPTRPASPNLVGVLVQWRNVLTNLVSHPRILPIVHIVNARANRRCCGGFKPQSPWWWTQDVLTPCPSRTRSMLSDLLTVPPPNLSGPSQI